MIDLLHKQYMEEALASSGSPMKSPAKNAVTASHPTPVKSPAKNAVTSPHPTPVKSPKPKKGKKRQKEVAKAPAEITPKKTGEASETDEESENAYVAQRMRERARAQRLARQKSRATVPDPASSDDEAALDDALDQVFAKERDELDREADADWNPHRMEQRGASLSVSPFARKRRSTRSTSVDGEAAAKVDGSVAVEDGGGRSKSSPPPLRRVLKPARKKGWNSIADKECPVDGCGYGRLFKMARYRSL